MPEQFPEDAGQDDESEIEGHVAHELGEADEVVEDVEVRFGGCEVLQLGGIRHSYIITEIQVQKWRTRCGSLPT